MKVAVIGAGIQGICTAYALAQQGARVSVFDPNGSAAEEASFANGSLLSAYTQFSLLDHVSVGAALASLFKRRPELHWNGLSPSVLSWARLARKLRHSPIGASRRKDLQELARHSHSRLNAWCHELRLDMDQSEGVMLLMRSADDLARWTPLLREMTESGTESRALEPDQARDMEHALREDTPLHQAVLLQEDGSANCRQFGLLLKTRAEEMGVEFHLNAAVLPWTKTASPRLVRTAQRDHGPFDAVVVCAGAHTPRLLQALGLRVALQRIQGFSISAAVREPLDATKSVVFDTRYQVSIARLGQRVRVAGGYTLGKDSAQPKQRLEMLYKVLDDWFPGAARTHDNPQVWQSAVIGTADGLPLVGPTHVPGLWINAAHGLNGWTLACGSAQLIAEQIAGQPSTLDPDKFNLTRWAKS